jgi:hypothetical protein
LITPLVFVDAGEDSNMTDDVVIPSNPLVAPVEEAELEETPLNVNVSQWLCDEKPFQRVVHTRIDHSAWDHQLSSIPHVLAIYLEFFPVHRIVSEKFEKCQCEDNDVRLHYQTWVPGDSHYHWL